MSADGMGSGGPTEAELQMMLAQMREAPAEQVLVEVINALLQAVQVKLGRPDARILLDAVAAMAESVRGRADAQLVDQVAGAVTQLRLAQVEAEGGASGGAGADGAGEGPIAAGEPRDAQAAAPSPEAQPGQQGASRLWVPGR
jgi:hypothetical protein